MTAPISDVSAKNNNYEQTAKAGGSNNAVGNALSTGNVGSAVSDGYSVQEQKKQSEIIELKNKINSLCDLLGTTSSQIFSIFGQNIENEGALTVDECKKRLEALNVAIKDATVNGKLNKELAIQLAKDYTIALNTGWSINGLKTHNKNDGALPLKERLINAGYLKNTDKEVSEEELEKAAEKLFKGLFDEKLSKAKTQKERDFAIKQQIQTFGRLLINTKGEDRTILVKAIKNLLQENRVQGVKNLFISSVDDEQKHEMAAKLGNEMPEIAEGIKDEDLIQIEVLRAINLSAEDKKQLPNEVKLQLQNFFNKYSEADIKALVELYKNKSSIENIPENLKEALKEYIYLVNISSGDITGLAVKDSNLTKEEHLNINKELDSNINRFGADTYNAVHVKTAEVIDKHPELLNMSKEEAVEFLDKVSNGQFSTIVKESGVAQGLIKGDAASSTGVGLEQKTSQEMYWSTSLAVEQKIQELYKEQENENKSYVVESNVKDEALKTPWQKFQIVKGLSAKELLNGIANKYIKINDVLDKYNELTQSAKDFINNLIKSMSRGIQNYVLNTLKGDIALDIAESANIDISKLKLDHLSFDQRKRAEAIQEKLQANN